MLRFGNREFRNLQEQVLKNMCDIQDIEQGATVLADFGITVVGQVDEASALPSPTTYKGNLGDAFLVGTEAPYVYYIYAKAYDGQEQASWYNLGQFPLPGPKGDKGDAAGFGTVTATATSVVGQPTVSVNTSGTNEAKNIAFEFGIPDVNPEYVEANPTASATGTLEKLRVDNTVYGLGGGTKLYKHTLFQSGINYKFILITTNPEPIDFSSIDNYEKLHDYLMSQNVIRFTNEAGDNIQYESVTDKCFYVITSEGAAPSISLYDDWSLSGYTTDTVTEL